jgi:predicted nuclease of predicted toxin-antitoxin system
VILAEENIEGEIVAKPRSEGFTVEHVSEWSPGANDDVILAHADELATVLLTEDKDFGELEQQAHSGVVLVRIHDSMPAADKADIVAAAFRKYGPEFPRRFTVITRGSIRIRHL